ncbi:MAG TPA: hypothetical protein DCE41_16475 [Cytophagales bacterium]|nr:hypothetical protein [Cytophagales bacterium]HAA24318.1 hypothetical protein [Cytophagales bacterium]HAP63975.1 hypothetical protein [Cytophagales bacterium]
MFEYRITLRPMRAPTQHVVKPYALQPELTGKPASHFIYVPPAGHIREQLLLFLGGTTSKPANYQTFPAFAARLGYHVINLSYNNDQSSLVCEQAEDLNCFTRFRQESLWGKGGPKAPNAESIWGRLIPLLKHLIKEYPNEGWQRYLEAENLLHHRIVLAGHSQGAGHVAFWAQQYAVDRVLLFAGPNDYSLRYTQAAPWLSKPMTTSKDRLFGVLHPQDEVIPVERQLATWQAMGLIPSPQLPRYRQGEEPIAPFLFLVDDPLTDQLGIAQLHSLMVADCREARMGKIAPPYEKLWQFLLTD